MSKPLLRILVVLLVPCLLVDSSFASFQNHTCAGFPPSVFQDKALTERMVSAAGPGGDDVFAQGRKLQVKRLNKERNLLNVPLEYRNAADQSDADVIVKELRQGIVFHHVPWKELIAKRGPFGGFAKRLALPTNPARTVNITQGFIARGERFPFYVPTYPCTVQINPHNPNLLDIVEEEPFSGTFVFEHGRFIVPSWPVHSMLAAQVRYLESRLNNALRAYPEETRARLAERLRERGVQKLEILFAGQDVPEETFFPGEPGGIADSARVQLDYMLLLSGQEEALDLALMKAVANLIFELGEENTMPPFWFSAVESYGFYGLINAFSHLTPGAAAILLMMENLINRFPGLLSELNPRLQAAMLLDDMGGLRQVILEYLATLPESFKNRHLLPVPSRRKGRKSDQTAVVLVARNALGEIRDIYRESLTVFETYEEVKLLAVKAMTRASTIPNLAVRQMINDLITHLAGASKLGDENWPSRWEEVRSDFVVFIEKLNVMMLGLENWPVNQAIPMLAGLDAINSDALYRHGLTVLQHAA